LLKKCSKALPEWKFSTQVSSKKLLSSQKWNTDLFVIKPDMLLEKKLKIVIADTKWKLPDERDKTNKFKIHQSDLYQLFTYAKYYAAQTVVLIYPKTDNFENTLHCDYIDQACGVIFTEF
jgi:5-methylcytosine-specific restriction enzyme subunit McrC